MKKITFIALFVISFTACESDDTTPVTNTEPSTIVFEEIFKFDFAGEDDMAGTYVVNDAAAWQNLKANLNAPYINNPETGEDTNMLDTATIDFTAFTLLAVVDEMHTSGGFDINVTDVVEADGIVTVTVETTSQGPGEATAVMTQPYHIVKIPKTTLPVVFE